MSDDPTLPNGDLELQSLSVTWRAGPAYRFGHDNAGVLMTVV